jgi:hypothetical protein
MALVTVGVWLRFAAIATRLCVARVARAVAAAGAWVASGGRRPEDRFSRAGRLS